MEKGKSKEIDKMVVASLLPKIGSLKIKVMQGMIYRDTELLGEMDAFIEILH